MLSLEEMISQLRKHKPNFLDNELFFVIKRGVIEVETVLRPFARTRLAHLFQKEITKRLDSRSSSIVLPGDAGSVIRAEVGGKAVPVLTSEAESAASNNYLYQNAAIRRGSDLEFRNIPAPTVAQKQSGIEVRVVYESSFETPIFVDGFYGFVTERPYTEGGVSLPVIELTHPSGRQFKDEFLKGSILRLHDSNKSAREWTIFRNYVETREVIIEDVPTDVDFQLFVMNDDQNVVLANLPTFAKHGTTGFPVRITRLGIPSEFREAVLLWAKAELTNEPRHRNEYMAYMQSLGVGIER